ncbi:MAG: tetratricopeptide repeat protein [Thermoplasmataceae archaeon]
MADYRNLLASKASHSIHLIKDGKPQEALKLIEDVLRVSPEDPEFINIRAAALHKAGREEEALEQIERCLKMEPDDVIYLKNKGVVLYDTGKYDEATKVLERSFSKDSSDSTTTYLISSSYLETGNYSMALEFANKTLKIDPKDAETHYLLYRIYDSMEDHNKSLKELQAAIKYDSENIEYRIKFAENLFDDDEREKALQELEKLTTKMGNYKESYIEKIILLFEYYENYEALKTCDYAIRKWPQEPDFMYIESIILSDDENDEEALELIDRALAIRKEIRYEEERTQLLGYMGRFQEVIETVSKNPNLLDGSFNVFPTYVEALITEGMKDRSVELVKDHLDTLKLEDILEILGIYTETKNTDDVLSICDLWFEKSGHLEIALILKFSVLLSDGMMNESLESVRSNYENLTPDGNALTRVYVARRLYGIGEYEKALGELNTEYDENLEAEIKDNVELTRIVLEMKINGMDQGMQTLRDFAKRVGYIETSAMIWDFMRTLEHSDDSLLYDLLNNVMPADDEEP